MKQRIGFIGLGIMGDPMSRNILKAGFPLTVYNRSAEKMEPLIQAGANRASHPCELVEQSDVVILMLTGPEAIDAIISADNNRFLALMNGKILINMSTVSPAYTIELNKKLAQYSIHFIDAPVSGSKKPAEEGTLIILAGGNKETITKVEPILLSMGKKVVYCGEAGKGSSMKMVVNLLLGIMMEGLCESINFGQKCGLATETILDTILSGPMSCGLFNLKTTMLQTGVYPPQFPFKHMTKDLRFVIQTGDQKGAALPIGYSVFQIYRQGMGHDLGDMDFCAVKKVLEQMSDV